jgi:hypothetical protein
MTHQADRRSRSGFWTLFEPNPGRRAEDVQAVSAWHPAARVGVVMMLAILGGINIWMDTALKINSLPTLQVAVSPAKLGYIAPTASIG